MSYCDIKNPPVFDLQVEKWDKTTRDNGEEMAVPIGKLFNNTLYNKAGIERLKGKELRSITVALSAWNNLSYTITDPVITPGSDIDVYFTFDTLPAAQKANIRGRQEQGKLVLVAKKLPAADLIIEKIKIVNPREEE